MEREVQEHVETRGGGGGGGESEINMIKRGGEKRKRDRRRMRMKGKRRLRRWRRDKEVQGEETKEKLKQVKGGGRGGEVKGEDGEEADGTQELT